MDKIIKPDFLTKVNLDYKARDFEQIKFESQLGRKLFPKVINSIPSESSIDYSLSVDKSFNELQVFLRETEGMTNEDHLSRADIIPC